MILQQNVTQGVLPRTVAQEVSINSWRDNSPTKCGSILDTTNSGLSGLEQFVTQEVANKMWHDACYNKMRPNISETIHGTGTLQQNAAQGVLPKTVTQVISNNSWHGKCASKQCDLLIFIAHRANILMIISVAYLIASLDFIILLKKCPRSDL